MNPQKDTVLLIVQMNAAQMAAFHQAILKDISSEDEADDDASFHAKTSALLSLFNALRGYIEEPLAAFSDQPDEWRMPSVAIGGQIRDIREVGLLPDLTSR